MYFYTCNSEFPSNRLTKGKKINHILLRERKVILEIPNVSIRLLKQFI